MRRRPSPLLAVLALGLVLRTLPWWPRHNLRGVLEYDDGVYYAAARLLVHGQLPYRDFTIVHPPGLSLLLLPAAGLGDWLGDPVGMAAGRVEVLMFALANIWLVHRLARRLAGPAAGLVAAGLYAIMPNAVAAEHTILLEPLATFACLVAAELLLGRDDPSSSRVAGAGFFLAAGVALKLFAGAYVVAAVGYLLWTRRSRALVPLAAGGLLGAAVLLAPFFLPDPGAAWHDIVVTQLSRPANPTVAHGLDRLVSMVGLGYATIPLGLLLIVVLLGSAASGLRSGPRALVGFWTVVLLLVSVAFATSPTYFAHYGEFLGPPVAVLAGRLLISAPAARVALAATAIAYAVGTGVGVSDLRGQADLHAVATAAVPRGSCVYFDAISLALAADVYEDPSARCPSYVDGRGVALTQNPHWDDRRSFYPGGFVADSAWQQANVAQMRHAGFLLLRHDPATFPEWSATTRQYVLTHFGLRTRRSGGRQPFELWQRTAAG